MTEKIRLSQLVGRIQEAIQSRFEGAEHWVTAQITDVKKYESNRRCYLTLEEYEHGEKTASAKAVFWANTYSEIERFEKHTRQPFKTGIEIICKVKVRFHKVYGLNLDVLQIDVAHTLGTVELERQQTLDRLLKEQAATIQLFDGVYRTANNRLPLPPIIKNITVITAPNSDGQRDFRQELTGNRHGYSFGIKEFTTTVQGDNAHKLILDQLRRIETEGRHFDAVAIVRGGGSQTDFRPFEDYALSAAVAGFPIPVFTGIGHDRNQSIVDLMARELKTPTKVASFFVDHNFAFENELMTLQANFFDGVASHLQNARNDLDNARRIVKLSSPEAILNRGFAIVMHNHQIITNPGSIAENTEIQTLLKNETIYSTVTKKVKDEKKPYL